MLSFFNLKFLNNEIVLLTNNKMHYCEQKSKFILTNNQMHNCINKFVNIHRQQ